MNYKHVKHFSRVKTFILSFFAFNFFMRVPTSQWAWGTSAHWQLYYSVKRFGRSWLNAFSTNTAQKVSCVNKKDEVVTVIRRNSIHTNAQSDSNKAKKRRRSTCYKLCSRRSSFSSSGTSVESEGCFTSEEVNAKLWENENTIEIRNKYIKSCATNQLASNQPNEDQIFITESIHDDGVLFGILDGHGGSAFSVHAKVRLPYYLHAALLDRRLAFQNRVNKETLFKNILDPNSTLQNQQTKWEDNVRSSLMTTQEEFSMTENAEHIMSYVSTPLKPLFGTSVVGQYNEPSKTEISLAIKDAFLQLDKDITSEISHAAGTNNLDFIPVAMSGCCALIAYIVKDELFLANLGDCRAVLGSLDGKEWSAVQLTHDHTAAVNPSEVKRIISEHPSDERWSCIQYGRLLGRLAPLRALGDIQFKLAALEQKKIFKGVSKYNPMRSLKTPPYLSAEPEVFNYKIEKNDKFIVLASDGLWDMLSNEEVVEAVAAYIEGNKVDIMKQRAHLFGVAHSEEILQDPNAFKDTAQENVASFLIRFALGGYDQNNLKAMMSLPYPDVRLYRDDISVAVLFINYVDA